MSDGPLLIPPRRLTANDWPRAADWNRLAEHVYRSTLGGGVDFDPAAVADLATAQRILARLVASDPTATPACPYAWRQIVRQANGSYVDHPYSFGGGVADAGGGFPAYEAGGNPHVPVDGTAVVWLRPGEGGSYFLFDWTARPVWVSLSGSSGASYGWTEKYPTSGGTWATLPGGMTGTTTQNAARELYGVTGLADGTVVQLVRGYSSGAPQAIVGRVRAGDDLVSEKQSLCIVGAVAGTYTITFEGQTTAPLSWNANAAAIEAALEALSNLVGVTVTGTGNPDGDPWVIEFLDDFSGHAVIQVTTETLRGDQEWLFAASFLGMTVEEQDGSPSYSAIKKLIVDQADGFVLTQPAAGQARLDQTPASPTTVGYVTTISQRFAGDKRFESGTVYLTPLTINYDSDRYLIAGDLSAQPSFTGAFGVPPDKANGIAIVAGAGTTGGGYLDYAAFGVFPFTYYKESGGGSSHVALGLLASDVSNPSFAVQEYSGALWIGGWATASGLVFKGGLYVSGSVSADITIDTTPVSGGTNNDLLFIKSGKVGQSADLAFDDTAKKLTLANQGYAITSRTTAPTLSTNSTMAMYMKAV